MTLAEEEEGASPRSVPVTNNLAQKLRMCIARGGDATTDDERKPLRWFEWFPVINLFVDMLGFDEIPSWDGVEKAWNLLALVDALLLTVVFQVPMAFEYDELLEINERYGNEQNGYGDSFAKLDNNKDMYSPDGRDNYLTYRGLFSSRIVYFFVVASASLSASFLSIVLCYIVASSSLVPRSEVNTGAQHILMKAFWKYVRWLVLAQTLFTMYGFAATYVLVSVTVEARFPDTYKQDVDRLDAQQEGLCDSILWGSSGRFLPAPSCTHGFTFVAMNGACAISLIPTLLILSCAVANRYYFRNVLEHHYASSLTPAAAPPPTASTPLALRGAAASHDACNSAEEDDDRKHDEPNAPPCRSFLLASPSFKRSSTGLSDVVKEHDSCFGVGIRLPWERKK
ncbi:hypothetical protein NFJ02_28g65200 [Pycnococcus provasolii]